MERVMCVACGSRVMQRHLLEKCAPEKQISFDIPLRYPQWKKVVSNSIDAFKEMEPKIFFDQAVFPSLAFKIT